MILPLAPTFTVATANAPVPFAPGIFTMPPLVAAKATMSGIELKRQLGSVGISTPVIFITANDSECTRKMALEIGCAAYLAKPFPTKLLIDAIEAASGSTDVAWKGEIGRS